MLDAASSDDKSTNPESPPGEEPRAGLPATPEAPPRRPDPLAELRLLPFGCTQEEPRFLGGDGPIPLGGAGGEARARRAPRDWGRMRAAASLAVVVVIGAAAAAAHVHALRVASAEQAQTRVLAHRLDTMSTRLESLEANRSRSEISNLHKVLAEIKAGAASTRDVGGAIGQLAARVDRLEKEQGARLDKLGDRIDHDSAARLADVAARLEKLEAKAATPVVAAAPAKPSPAAKTTVAKAEPGVSYETTGALARPHLRNLRGYWLADIQNGYAMIGGPSGEFAVGPGDFVPGAGRVLRIERHGRDWAVVTTQGQILAEDN